MRNVFLGVTTFCFIFAFATQAMADQMYGVLMVVKGSVKIQNASKQSTDAKVGGKVLEGETIITGADARAKIVMSDRNVINVNPDTQVTITTYKNDAATGEKNVELNLLKGKVRNNVEQTYDGEKNKFLIKTPTAVAGVRGTQFLAGFDPGTRMTSVVTFKGAVSLASVGANGKVIGAPVIVKKGEMTSAAPNVVPEPPKTVPKEEMKKMDGESTASAAKENKENKDAKDNGNKDSKENKEAKDNKDPKDGKESKEPKEASNKDKSSKEKREMASDGPASPTNELAPPPPAMVDSRDMDMSIAKEVVIPTAAPPPTPPPMVTPMATPAPTPPPALFQPKNSKVNIQPIKK